MTHRARTALALSLFAGLVAAPAATSAQQYVNLPGTQPGEFATAEPLDGANPCGVTCHFSRDPDIVSPMPHDTILGSMMGNTMRDPLFLAALTVADQDAPGVGDYCLRCHTPTGFVAGRTRGNPAASRGGSLTSLDRDGITCDSCHRMVASPNLGNAQYVLSPTDVRYGPYPTITSIRHPGAVSTWLPDSRMCATCHNITNPAQPQRDAMGRDTGRRMPLDTTYSEWVQSDFGRQGSSDYRTCQDCHMPRMTMPGFVATNETAMRRNNPRRHDLVGGNAWMIRVMGRLREETASGDFYDPDTVPFYEAAARRAEAMLRSAVRLEITNSPRDARPGAQVQLTARITNLSGHRVPTGYVEGRRMWLDVTLVDADRRETVVSGNYNMTEATLDTSDRQLKVYETHHGRVGMGFTYHIALNDTVLDDTRIPPKGYRPLPGHEPVNADYSGGAGGTLRHWDDARYTFTIPANARGPVTVRVRARYQSTTRSFVEFLVRENRTDNTGRNLQRLYDASGRSPPVTMAEATAQITLPGGVTDGGVTDGGATDGGLTDAGRTDAGRTDAATVDATTAPVDATASGGLQCAVPSTPGAPAKPSAALLAGVGLALAARRRRRR